MRKQLASLFVLASLLFTGCTIREAPVTTTEAERERERQEKADDVARKAGRAAHKVANETEDLAKKAGREIKKAAKGIREGWKEAEQEERVKPKPRP